MSASDRIWRDRKRYFGLPISFTKYSLDDERLFVDTGILNLKGEEILLYRVKDLVVTRSLWQRIFRVGTVTVFSGDQTTSELKIQSVKRPVEVKDLIYEKVEAAKAARRMRTAEILDDAVEDDMDPV